MTTSIDDIDLREMLRFDDLKAMGVVADRKTLKAWMRRKTDPFPASIPLSELLE
jgi:hypothetical protein